ncbi:MAG TPA: hypothetical protein VNA19_14020 [Pyrinomonadaceae bacterium]|jgi:hypothetical protein|nr:hypothetical protein [Pyrinomonadaceae bacterium]
MPEHRETARVVHENLDTAYVNLGALLRYLRARDFVGRVHVELDEYEVEIFVRGQEELRVREMDFASGRVEEGAGALQRVLVRAQEAGGLLSVYEGGEAATDEAAERRSAIASEVSRQAVEQQASIRVSEEEAEQRELLEVSGELLGAVERAAAVAGGDFASALHRARIGLADDYPFLDPVQRRFEYRAGTVRLQGKVSTGLYVSGVSEALRRAVEHIATEGERIGIRRDVARELSTLKRRRQTALARFKFTTQLERIAGMKLL